MLAYEELQGSRGREIRYRPPRYQARALFPHMPVGANIGTVPRLYDRSKEWIRNRSRELLEAWRPQIALISCGRMNPFGHPAPEVVARLQAIDARVYRTDLDGEITIDTDGQHVSVATFTGEKR